MYSNTHSTRPGFLIGDDTEIPHTSLSEEAHRAKPSSHSLPHLPDLINEKQILKDHRSWRLTTAGEDRSLSREQCEFSSSALT